MKATHHDILALARYPQYFTVECSDWLKLRVADCTYKTTVRDNGEAYISFIRPTSAPDETYAWTTYVEPGKSIDGPLSIKLRPAFQTMTNHHGLCSLIQ
jgi:hypothetical protein